jgi:peptide-methionine (S)-S-oxide reductase
MVRSWIIGIVLTLCVALISITPAPLAAAGKAGGKTATAIFAMGCFWCAESDMQKVPGVKSVVSGYTGGSKASATYEQVSKTETGHYEAILVTYDPAKISYAKLLTAFWKNVDPFDAKGQFCDKGNSYRSAIFPGNATEMAAANASKDFLAKDLNKTIATKILPRQPFYPAEDYHQDYAKKNPVRYDYYRGSCGRDARLKAIWG